MKKLSLFLGMLMLSVTLYSQKSIDFGKNAVMATEKHNAENDALGAFYLNQLDNTEKVRYKPSNNRGSRGAEVCDSVLNIEFPGIKTYGAAKDDITYIQMDLDAGIIHDNITDLAGQSAGFTTFSEFPNFPDTTVKNYFYRGISYFNPAGSARNWFFINGIIVPDSGATLKWKHRILNETYRDGYKVTIMGNSSMDIKVFIDNDPETEFTAGQWVEFSAEIPAGTFAGDTIAINFDHNATDMVGIDFDDVEVIACRTEAGAKPSLNFSTNIDTIYEGQTIQYTDSSSNNPTDWAWTFEGGTPATSMAQNPLVTYNTAGLYHTKLVVSNSYGADSITTPDIFLVKEQTGPTADTSFAYCVGDAILDLTATANDGGTLTWYSDEDLILDEATGATFVTGLTNLIAGETCFYVTETVSSVESEAVKVCIDVNAVPSSPVAMDPSNICEGETADSAEVLVSAGTITWYSDSNLQLQVATGDLFDIDAHLINGVNDFYITDTKEGCTSDSVKVSITVTAKDTASFYYSSGTYCKDGSNPKPTLDGTLGGTFTSSSFDLSFVSSSTGEIDLSLTDTGSYSISYITGGTCPDTMVSPLVKIISSPDVSFSYTSVSYCKNGAAASVLPIAVSSGLFSASPAGLIFTNVNTGEVDLINSAAGNYTVKNLIDTSSGCTADSATFALAIKEVGAPTVTSILTLCVGSIADPLTATAENSGRLVWYSDEELTDSIGEGASFDAGFSTASTALFDYYVVEKNGSCVSAAASINVEITGSIAAPTASSATYCAGETIADLTASGSGGVYNWYSDASLSTKVGSGASYASNVSNSTADTTSFYVTETQSTCVSSAIKVDVIVNASPSAPTVVTPSDYDFGATIADATASGSGGTLTWYSNVGLTTEVGTGSPFSTGVDGRVETSTCFYVTETSNGCEGTASAYCITVLADTTPVDTTPVDTVITGGGTYDTTVVTTCDSVFSYNFDDGDYSGKPNSTYIDTNNYGLYIYDLDKRPWFLTPDTVRSWGLAYEDSTKTNLAIRNVSWYVGDTVASDDWMVFGPISMASSDMTFYWKHLTPLVSWADGYEVMVSNTGGSPSIFKTDGEVLFSVVDQDPSATNVWSSNSVTIDAATYANDSIFIAIHHNANNMNVLFIDDILLGTCVNDTTIDTTYGPVANFQALNTTINEGGSVNFIDDSQNDPTTWKWTFSGGTPSTSTSQNPNGITYANVGNYEVKLVVTNQFGSDSITKSNFITVQVVDTSGTSIAVPIADFTYSADTIQVGTSVTFTDISSNTPSSWSWSLGGASPSAASTQNVTVTYNVVGTYDVILGASNSAGLDIETKQDLIVVVDTTKGPEVAFTSDRTNVSPGGTIDFTDLSTNNPTSWSWVFEGGAPSTSNAQHPSSIRYSTDGIYDVSLTVTNIYGTDSETKVDHITVAVLTNVEGEIESSLLIFPNPSNGMMTVEFATKKANEGVLEVYNMTGQKVYSENLRFVNHSVKTRIDLSELPNGVYTISLMSDEGVSFREKVIIE